MYVHTAMIMLGYVPGKNSEIKFFFQIYVIAKINIKIINYTHVNLKLNIYIICKCIFSILIVQIFILKRKFLFIMATLAEKT